MNEEISDIFHECLSQLRLNAFPANQVGVSKKIRDEVSDIPHHKRFYADAGNIFHVE